LLSHIDHAASCSNSSPQLIQLFSLEHTLSFIIARLITPFTSNYRHGSQPLRFLGFAGPRVCFNFRFNQFLLTFPSVQTSYQPSLNMDTAAHRSPLSHLLPWCLARSPSSRLPMEALLVIVPRATSPHPRFLLLKPLQLPLVAPVHLTCPQSQNPRPLFRPRLLQSRILQQLSRRLRPQPSLLRSNLLLQARRYPFRRQGRHQVLPV